MKTQTISPGSDVWKFPSLCKSEEVSLTNRLDSFCSRCLRKKKN